VRIAGCLAKSSRSACGSALPRTGSTAPEMDTLAHVGSCWALANYCQMVPTSRAMLRASNVSLAQQTCCLIEGQADCDIYAAMQQLASGSVLEQACGSCASATVNVAIEFLCEQDQQDLDTGWQAT
jgi:hypothetical protein